MRTVYVTKYGLTGGIVKTRVLDEDDKYCTVVWPGGLNGQLFLKKGDCQPTEAEAVAAVRAQAARKITNLKKQIAKLEKYRPTVKDANEEKTDEDPDRR